MEESENGATSRNELERIFGRLRLVPNDIVKDVYTADYAEDGKTFVLMLETEGGKTMMVVATPGEPLRLSVL